MLSVYIRHQINEVKRVIINAVLCNIRQLANCSPVIWCKMYCVSTLCISICMYIHL